MLDGIVSWKIELGLECLILICQLIIRFLKQSTYEQFYTGTEINCAYIVWN